MVASRARKLSQASMAPAFSADRPVVADHIGASTFIEKGWSRISLGDYVGAEESLTKALQLVPEISGHRLMMLVRLMRDRGHDFRWHDAYSPNLLAITITGVVYHGGYVRFFERGRTERGGRRYSKEKHARVRHAPSDVGNIEDRLGRDLLAGGQAAGLVQHDEGAAGGVSVAG